LNNRHSFRYVHIVTVIVISANPLSTCKRFAIKKVKQKDRFYGLLKK
jgi:hypothetical protein